MSNAADAIERAILDGVDTAPASSYREDRRAAEKSPVNTDDELGSDLPSDGDDDGLYDRDDDDDVDLPATSSSHAQAARGGSSSSGVSRTTAKGGATNTGPKGVLRDSQRQAEQERRARGESVQKTNQRMEKLAFTSETYAEQVAREKRESKAKLNAENRDTDDEEDAGSKVSKEAIADLQAKERRREERLAQLKAQRQAQQQQPPQQSQQFNAIPNKLQPRSARAATDRWFGHLREVDERGYVSAIDSENASVPVVIHIYSKAVEECNVLTHSLSSLARLYPRTKFLQVQASAIGFGASTSTSTSSTLSGARGNGANPGDAADDDEDEYDEFDPKALEVLPTLLVYKAGTLVANLVRIDLDDDWKGGKEQSIRNILLKYDALVGDDAKHGPSTMYGDEADEDDD